MKAIIIFFQVWFVMLASVSVSAAPDGSLRKMLDTQITLLEYIEIKTKLESIERLATGKSTRWGRYYGVVKLSARFDYEEGELIFDLEPVDTHDFSTVAEAKSYCRDLISAERIIVWLLLVTESKPNGWSIGLLDTDDFFEKLYGSSKIRVSVVKTEIAEELPERENFLECEASLDNKGKVKRFSYNL
jgi:hypothetical protein